MHKKVSKILGIFTPCAGQAKTSLASDLIQLGGAHWSNIDAGTADGTVKGYCGGVENDMAQGENIRPEEALKQALPPSK